MALDLARIPDAYSAPAQAAPSAAMSAVRRPYGRRTVLRAAVLGALTAGAVVADWAGRVLPGRPAHAESGPGGLTGWDNVNCEDAYPKWHDYRTGIDWPGGYNQQQDASGAYRNYPYVAACFGGFISSNYCSGGWHRSGSQFSGGVVYTYTPITTACGARPDGATRNAWRWRTTSSVTGTLTWRCSDGTTRAGSGLPYLTVCRALV
jgi:hypothetical protein